MEELQRELEAPTFGQPRVTSYDKLFYRRMHLSLPPSSMAAPGNSSWKSRCSTEGVFHVHLIILILKIQMIYDEYMMYIFVNL